MLTHICLESVPKRGIGLLQNKVESVVTTSFQIKICSVLLRIQIIEKHLEVAFSFFIIVFQRFELAHTENSAYFCATNVISRICKNEFGGKIWMLGDIFISEIRIKRLSNHAVRSEHPDHFIDIIIIRTDHSPFHRTHVMGKVKREIGS